MLLLHSLVQSGDWQENGRQRAWHMARWTEFNVQNNVHLILPSHWSTIISMHFLVGTREKDRQVQFRFIACLLIDPTVHKLHTVSLLQPLDLLPVYHHTKVTFSAAPGSAIWASWDASWKVFTNEVSYYTPSLLTFWCLKGFPFLLSWLVFVEQLLLWNTESR